MAILFVNACGGNEASHTLRLCRAYLEGDPYDEVDLAVLDLRPLTAAQAADRAVREAAGAWDDPMFGLAHQLAAADEVVVGAPYWDLSFPAALKVYVEHASVNGATFHYTEEGRYEGLCRSRRMVYVSSCGGYVAGANYGYEYMCGIARMFGLGETFQIAAEGMDVRGVDTDAVMADALARVRALRDR